MAVVAAFALVVSGLSLTPAGAWVLQAAKGGGDGLPTSLGPTVTVGSGKAGSGKTWSDSPNWKPEPVKSVPVGSGKARAGKAFAKAGTLPVEVADAATGKDVIAAAMKSADGLLTPKERAAALAASKTAARVPTLSADSPKALWKMFAANAPGVVAGPHSKDHGQAARAIVSSRAPPAGKSAKSKSVASADPAALVSTTATKATKATTATTGPTDSVPTPSDATTPQPSQTSADGGGEVAVTTLPASVVTKVGGRDIGFTVERTEPGTGPVAVRVDYSSVMDAYGGDYGARLRLVSYPACILTTPSVPDCQTGTPLTGVNDPAAHTMTALVKPAAADDSAPSPTPSASDSPTSSPTGSPATSDAGTPTGPASPAAPSSSPSASTDAGRPSDSPTRQQSPSSSPADSPAATSAPESTGSASPAVGALKPAGSGSASNSESAPVDLTGRMQLVSASRPLAAAAVQSGTVVVASAGLSSSYGAYTATPLAAAGKWAVGTQSGDFTYSYPLPAVPAPAGGTPDLNLQYSSGAVDGMTAAENPQSSDVGAGWSMDVPFIERQYMPCTDASLAGNTCWGVNAPILTWNGHSGPLVFMGQEDGTNTDLWRMTDDDGWLIERIRDGNTVNPNGDSDGEYWLLTDTEGTQYAFGREDSSLGGATNSTLNEPIYGPNAGDTCNPQPSHKCTKAWRWNLSYVIDQDQNLTRYTWSNEKLSYAVSSTAPAQHYDAVSHLVSIEYGLTRSNAASTKAPARMLFDYGWRCTQTTCQGPETDPSSWYPDLPYDLYCAQAATTCPSGPTSPVYFTPKRLTTVHAQKWSGTGTTYTDVDRVALGVGYPDHSGAAQATMFLNSVVRSGVNGGTVDLPQVHFGETWLANRLNPNTSLGQTTLEKPRIGVVNNEFGGTTTVTYAQPNACNTSIAADVQTSDCYPRRDPDGSTSWYRKWITTQVDESDSYGAPTQTTTWEYDPGGQGVAWHSDDDPLVPASLQGWTDYRGYRRVLVHTGTGANRTTDEYRYLRGMDGDHLSNGTQRSVTQYTSDSADGDTTHQAYEDYPWLTGQLIEHRTLRADGSELSSEQYDFSSYVVNDGAGGPFGIHSHQVVQIRPAYDITMTKVGTVERARKHITFRSFEHQWGRQISEEDSGDPVNGIGASCDYTVYPGWDASWDSWVPDLTDWIIDEPRQELSLSTDCPSDFRQVPSTTSNPDLISRSDLYYGSDWTSLDSVPHTDNVTKTVDYADATTPVRYSGIRYDAKGRQTGEIAPDNFDPSATSFATAGPASTTAFTETNGLVSRTVDTDPSGATTTTDLDPGRQLAITITDANGRITTVGYDAIGRTVRERESGDTYDSQTFAYTVSNTSPSSVRTDSFPASGAAAISSWDFIDSLGRSYQSQSKSSSGAQVVEGVRYDNQGNPTAQIPAFAGTGTAGTVVPNWYSTTLTNQIPSTTVTTYDDAGRETATALVGAGPSTLWTATTAYDGMSTTSTPPSNSAASEPNVAPATVTKDDYGRTVSTTQAGKTSTYTYDISGNLTKQKTPNGAESVFRYDWLGNRTSTIDPDAGTSTAIYYPSGMVKRTHDAKGQDLYTAVDVLDRPTATYAGTSDAGLKLSQNVYDGIPLGGTTALKGTTTSQTSYVGANAYTQLFGYDQRYRVTRADQVIPAAPGLSALAGTYTTTSTYDGMDRPVSVTYPAVGGLASETVTTGYSGDFATTLTGDLGGTSTPYVASTTYTGRGEVAARVLGAAGATGSVQRTNTFDGPTGRLTRQAATTPSTGSTANVQDDNYTYAPTGQVTKTTDAISAQQQCFTYDTRNRLTAAFTSSSTGTPGTKTGNACTADSSGPTPYNEAYAYDDDGNLTSLTHSGTARTYGYGNNATRGLTGGPHAPTTVTSGSTTTTYTYDANGQLTQKVAGGTTSSYTWDAQHTLTAVSDTTGSTTNSSSFTTGPDGSRWVRKTPAETVVYLNGQELHQSTGASTTTAVRYYTQDDSTIAVRKTGTGAGLTWALGDAQGSASIAVSAGNGSLVRDRYLPFGGNRATSRTLPTDHAWLGQIQDSETGLDYLNARYYDPTLAHFISTDPLNDSRTPQTANPYAYAADNPTTFTDPTGLSIPGCDCSGGVSDPALNYTTKKTAKKKYVQVNQRPKRKTGLNNKKVKAKQAADAKAVARVKAQHKKEQAQKAAAAKAAAAKKHKGGIGGKILGGIHLGLQGAGLIPGVGLVTDSIDGSIYLVQNKKLDAAISFAAAVPIGGDGLTTARWAGKAAKAAGSSGEVILPTAKSFESARNQALDLLGPIDSATRVPYTGRLENSPSTFGKVVGFETRPGGLYKRLRMDYDPEKGPHFNVEIGKGANAQKFAVPWAGSENQFERLLGGNS